MLQTIENNIDADVYTDSEAWARSGAGFDAIAPNGMRQFVLEQL